MENEFLKFLQSQIAPAAVKDSSVKLGIGDDAALIEPMESPACLTMDTIVDGVHFDSLKHSMSLIGRKALAVNLSDLAAMGAKPHSFLLSLTVSGKQSLEDCRQMVAGMTELGNEFGMQLIGGDFVRSSGPLSLTVTAIGSTPWGHWTQSGARVGDEIMVSGSLGGSILGRHLSFVPRLDVAEKLDDQVVIHAATDISDGFLIDLNSICRQSDVGAQIDLDRIPISDAARKMAIQSGRPSLEHALEDGEDFELILVVENETANWLEEHSSRFDFPLHRVGRIVKTKGLWENSKGQDIKLEPKGYRHGNE